MAKRCLAAPAGAALSCTAFRAEQQPLRTGFKFRDEAGHTASAVAEAIQILTSPQSRM